MQRGDESSKSEASVKSPGRLSVAPGPGAQGGATPMPSAKNDNWKYRQFSEADWLAMAERFQTKLALRHFLQWLPAQREVAELRKSNTARRKYE